MAPRYALEIVNRTLQDIMNNDLPFRCQLWTHFIKYSLTQNMRVRANEVEFAKFLLDVGDGILNDENDNLSLPETCILERNHDLVQNVFGQLISEQKFTEIGKSAILAPRNIDVDEINKKVTNLLDSKTERRYTGIDSTENCNNGDDMDEVLTPEYLNTLNPPSLPPYELCLRKNCIIMLIRNISINESLCNGDRSNNIVCVNRITLYCESEFPFSFKRRQFPVKLAFAMTINKSQGQTFDKIGIDLRRNVFNHGQLYVAMSRVRSWDSLVV
ncbi:ATP-dependent DNA helicase PIF1-like [Nasonia vitripennis]|uniref:DNA helicase Pif1-like 2B domain-containing protein n=1 Tax=Nasonia vitripennis TaxID=7425 RepID=A0A7M7TBB8_NASVI|nr:ATP-dependent DNA helicase PIF1-like [Nasonia vitripennis]